MSSSSQPPSHNPLQGFLGIDNGTQGLSVLFTDQQLRVYGTGEATYEFVADTPAGCYEQWTRDWDAALTAAMKHLQEQLATQHGVFPAVLAIGILGQMHGEVLVGGGNDNDTGPPTQALAPVRLWCDAQNAAEGDELTRLFATKVPKRSTAARFLWTAHQKPALASKVHHITTPAGWCAYRLTGQFCLGIGDASGMFPMDAATRDYDVTKLQQYDVLLAQAAAAAAANNDSTPPTIRSMADLLPTVRCAGQDAGCLTADGAALLGLDISEASKLQNIPVAPAEGDQVAALAGSLIARPGTILCSFGTSVCANAIGGSQPFQGVSPAVDQFCAHDASLVNMVWLRNGTTFLNTVVESYAYAQQQQQEPQPPNDNDSNKDTNTDNDTNDKDNVNICKKQAFAAVMPQMIAAPADCGGLLALPFMDDEPGLGVRQGGSACLVGWNTTNARPGHVAKAALLSTMFNLKRGVQVLDQQGYPRTQLVLTGGLSKTPACGQILADVFDTPVQLLVASAEEGCLWGAAVMAKYRYQKCMKHSDDNNETVDWATFLESALPPDDQILHFTPNPETVPVYEQMFARYLKLVQLQSQLTEAVHYTSNSHNS